MKKTLERSSPVSWFTAGMGTVLSVMPVTALDRNCETVTPNQRLSNATSRVGGYFNVVIQREKAKKREQQGQKTA